MSQLFRTKSIDRLIEQSQDPQHRLKRVLGPWSLIGLGVGAVIGTGIFVLTGTAAAGESVTVPSIIKAPLLDLILHGGDAVSTFGRPGAGPGIALSFLLTAVVCGLAALCYAELASMIPVAGSAYTFAYATMGELIAWIIGWDLILEYAVSNMAVAVGFSAYFNDVLDSLFGLRLPEALSRPPIESGEMTGAIFNLPAFLVLMILTVLLVRGVRESAKANNVMVLIKVGAILIFIFGAARAVDPANYQPFLPNGFQGLLTGAAIVFFTYIGFDSVSTAAEECSNPQRDLPIGIVGTLAACAILYVSVALVLTGIVNWSELGNAAPVVNALKSLGFTSIRQIVGVGARRWNDLFADGIPVRAGTDLVRHVARRASAACLFSRASTIQDASHQHLGRRAVRRHPGRSLGHRYVCRPGQYRHAVRLRGGLGGSDHSAQDTAGPQARFPRSVGSVGSAGRDRSLFSSHVGAAAGDLDSLCRMASRGACDLLALWPQAQRICWLLTAARLAKKRAKSFLAMEEAEVRGRKWGTAIRFSVVEPHCFQQ